MRTGARQPICRTPFASVTVQVSPFYQGKWGIDTGFDYAERADHPINTQMPPSPEIGGIRHAGHLAKN
jgi:hypothetical protein